MMTENVATIAEMFSLISKSSKAELILGAEWLHTDKKSNNAYNMPAKMAKYKTVFSHRI